VLLAQDALAQNPTYESGLTLFRRGEYSEAAERFRNSRRSNPKFAPSYVAESQALAEVGDYDKALNVCTEGLKEISNHPDLLVQQGRLQELLGRYAAARRSYEAALAADPMHPQARFYYGRHLWLWGRKVEARSQLRPLLDLPSGPSLTAERLHLAAKAAIYLGRFHEANRFFDQATRLDPTLWQALVDWGDLFLEKYNAPDARSAYEDALKVNPKAAPAHLGIAKVLSNRNLQAARASLKKALDINPKLVAAIDYDAELSLLTGEYDEALKKLDRSLKINPNSLSSLGLRAVAFHLQGEEQRRDAEIARLLQINPNYSEVYYRLGEADARRYLFKESVEWYRRAIDLDPENWAAHAGLGISLSRLGEEREALRELETAFANDRFNVYIGNLLRLFDDYVNYRVFETPHFRIRVHKDDAEVLAAYAMELAEAAYAEITRRYGYEPPEKTLIEIYPQHDDFAVRSFGLPGQQAFLGICFGKVITMDSPRARPKGGFNWGETLWHEFVHVIHLQLTENRIPRWLAEGISVYETTRSHPDWRMNLDLPFILAMRHNKLLPLKELDTGFMRMNDPTQVSLSYFQASQVVAYIVETYGMPKLVALFEPYRQGKSTPEAIREVFGKDVDDLDAEFRAWVTGRLAPPEAEFDPVQIDKDEPMADRLSSLAKAVEKSPNNFFANLAYGRALQKAGREDDAIPFLRKAIYLFPGYVDSNNAYQTLADIYLSRSQPDSALELLERYTNLQGKDAATIRKLGNLYRARGQYEEAARILKKAIYITPFEPEVHRLLGDTYLKLGKAEAAITEFRTALAAGPLDKAEAHYNLARAYLAAGRKSEAKAEALAALEIAPEFERAQELLLETIEP
jgi:tetratricopeptide (TPR) repeat protein